MCLGLQGQLCFNVWRRRRRGLALKLWTLLETNDVTHPERKRESSTTARTIDLRGVEAWHKRKREKEREKERSRQSFNVAEQRVRLTEEETENRETERKKMQLCEKKTWHVLIQLCFHCCYSTDTHYQITLSALMLLHCSQMTYLSCSDCLILGVYWVIADHPDPHAP